jgi:hypothetical protein
VLTLTDFLANLSRAVPCDLKILTFALNKSLRSMPSLRGIAPTNKATSTSLKAVSSLSVGTTPTKNSSFQCSNRSSKVLPLTKGKLVSSISITTPWSTPIIGVISSK